MAMVIGVRFRRAGKIYYFDPDAMEIHAGDAVVVDTARGLEYGEVVTGVHSVPDAQIVVPLKPVLRMATEQDTQTAQSNIANEPIAYDICQDKIVTHKLEMKLVDVEYTFDNSKIIFYFTANGRVDFRALVKDLASVFKTRIELRQIGVRDEAKMLGGLGPCGRQICCGAFLGDFQPVSIKMAKEQSLSLNPTKISGVCGRLMCCLKYEQETYEQMRKRMPRVGKDIHTPDGVATVLDIYVLKETVKVRIAKGDSYEIREYAVDDCARPTQEQINEAREQAAERAIHAEARAERAAAARNGKRPAARQDGRPARGGKPDAAQEAQPEQGKRAPGRAQGAAGAGRGRRGAAEETAKPQEAAAQPQAEPATQAEESTPETVAEEVFVAYTAVEDETDAENSYVPPTLDPSELEEIVDIPADVLRAMDKYGEELLD